MDTNALSQQTLDDKKKEAANYYMSVPEVCALLKITRSRLYQKVRAKEIPHVQKLGMQLLFHRARLMQWLDNNTTKPRRVRRNDHSKLSGTDD